MSWWPGDSRALGVLLGFRREIGAFVASDDLFNLRRASWWLHRSATRAVGGAEGLWPTDEQLEAQTQRLHTRLARGGGHSDVRKKRTRLRLAPGQVRVLLRDLLLVASGLRASCLVDCCALSKELVGLLLSGLEHEAELLDYRWCAVHRVRAVLLDGNVFFVHVDAFVREKMVGLATGWQQQMCVDVSASLSRPQLIRSDGSEAEAARLQALAEWTVTACRELLRSTPSEVLQWRRPMGLSAPALAGILLCYPCVYDVLADKDSCSGGADDDEWGAQENCLAMCPLVVLHTSALMPPQQLAIALLEFSVPRHLLAVRSRFNQAQEPQQSDAKLAKLLRARCRLELRRAIEHSALLSAGVRPQVRGDTRSLPRVAL
ncbi:putative mitochondrial protein [Phytophthora cinnamomi]|uniref:putative mitochondrial protein n=1 Tax=Phytophthora cinnamomi TaxID=4785 RepID=UPI00355AB93D|nr:putative mitochondrial protein [Phytophthora cinnamomi]